VEIKCIRNSKKTYATALNLGIAESNGDCIMAVGSHCEYPKDYIIKCIDALESHPAHNTGGCIKSIPREEGILAASVNIARQDIFGAGRSPFRQGTGAEPVFVDTVFGGCYKREVFDKIGLFNENMARSADMEFNLRLKEAGMKTLLLPDLYVKYYARSTIREMMKHNFKDGMWIILPFAYSKVKWSKRYMVPMLFVLTLPLSIWPYAVLAIVRSAQIATKEGWWYFFVMPWVFFLHHLSYGVGSIWGGIKLLCLKSHLRQKK